LKAFWVTLAFVAAFLALIAYDEAKAAQVSFDMPLDNIEGEPLANVEMGVLVWRRSILGNHVVATGFAYPGDHVILYVPRETGRWYATTYYLSSGIESAPSNTGRKGSGCYIMCHGD